jgi:hypothetical protein
VEVLDNGVVSNEFWRILDCADDLSWAGKRILFRHNLFISDERMACWLAE